MQTKNKKRLLEDEGIQINTISTMRSLSLSGVFGGGRAVKAAILSAKLIVPIDASNVAIRSAISCGPSNLM